jgi:hypothetical protein
MKAFHTKQTPARFSAVMHAIETACGSHPLYSRDCSRMIFDYTLYEPRKHTVDRACKENNVALLQWLVTVVGANIHGSSEHALRMASRDGRLEIVKYLVSQGANIHAIDDCAVRWASCNGHLEIVRFLVSVGADVSTLDSFAVRRASENGHLEIVKLLVQVEGPLRRPYRDYPVGRDSAVGVASRSGHLEIVKYLVEEGGADGRVWGDQALRMAIQYGHVEIAEYLTSLTSLR